MQYLFYLSPVGLSVLAFVVLWVGWPRASGYRRPSRYLLGLVLVAGGLICLWLIPVCLYEMVDGLETELQGLLYLLAIFASFGIAGGGLEMIRKANNTWSDDFWDSL